VHASSGFRTRWLKLQHALRYATRHFQRNGRGCPMPPPARPLPTHGRGGGAAWARARTRTRARTYLCPTVTAEMRSTSATRSSTARRRSGAPRQPQPRARTFQSVRPLPPSVVLAIARPPPRVCACRLPLLLLLRRAAPDSQPPVDVPLTEATRCPCRSLNRSHSCGQQLSRLTSACNNPASRRGRDAARGNYSRP